MSAALETSLSFDRENHIYSLGGRVLLSVSEILKGVGMVDERWFDEHSRWRGSQVHAMCHYDDEGDLDEASLDDQLKGYLEAYRRFKSDMGFVAQHNEQRVYHEALGYAGTFDIKGTFVHGPCLPDIKSGAVHRVTRLQTVAYAATQSKPRTLWRLGLGIGKDGKYSLQVYPPKDFDRDFRRWQTVIEFFHVRRELRI